jgi:dihydropteroate synthase
MRLRGRELDLRWPHVVGVLNLTPDSFSDGGELPDLGAVVARAQQMAAEGVDVLDLGGESTRPGAQPVSEEQELARVLPAVRAVVAAVDRPVSVDTRRAAVAARALAEGAAMVNDVSGFADPDMAAVVARHDAAWVLMHMPHAVGAMAASQAAGMSTDLRTGLAQVRDDLAAAVARAEAAGVGRGQLALDPGIGFGKTLAQNLALLRGSIHPYGNLLATLGLPLYLGPSRKSFIAAVGSTHQAGATHAGGWQAPPQARLPGTAAAVTAAVLGGAAFVRVHDVGAMRQVVDVAVALRDA